MGADAHLDVFLGEAGIRGADILGCGVANLRTAWLRRRSSLFIISTCVIRRIINESCRRAMTKE